MEKLGLVVAKSNTDSVAPNERLDYWADLTVSYQGRLGFGFPEVSNFRGGLTLCRSNRYQLVGWESAAVSYHRATSHIREDTDDSYRFVVSFDGSAQFWDDRGQVQVPSGVGSVVSLDHRFGFGFPNGTRGALLTVARRELDDRMRIDESLAARPIDLNTGLGPMVTDMLSRLVEAGDSLDAHQFDTATSHLLDLLALHAQGQQVVYADRIDELANSVRHHVRSHAADPDLSTGSIARALGWSVRQIQIALQRSGTTPRELIREERLRLAKLRLGDPGYRDHSIAAIAMALGFGSAATFSTTFRRRFGVSPRDIRAAAGQLV